MMRSAEVPVNPKNGDCQIELVHPLAVKKAGEGLPPPARLQGLSDFFKVMGDETRLRILHALTETELCVCDLASLMNVSRSAVSHQLSLLRRADLVSFRREGKVSYYSLKDDHVRSLLDVAGEHLEEGGL